jgi:hypothetical protein
VPREPSQQFGQVVGAESLEGAAEQVGAPERFALTEYLVE